MQLGLFSETILVTAAMAVLCIVPLVSERAQRHSGTLVLMGTGAMLGLCVFDLIPDVFEMGRWAGIVLTAVVWTIYSAMHVFHLDHHHAEVRHGTAITPSPFFFYSIIGHCFASGMLLTVSRGYSVALSVNVYVALLIHKAYEALTVSSILVGDRESQSEKLLIIGIYSLSFPLGVSAAFALGDAIGRVVALSISSVAVGTLLGCLIFDFVVPSFFQLRKRRSHIVWIAVGLVLTQAVMRAVSH